ncbi:hypothetical protein, partial [Streptomyces oceani]
MRSEEQRRRQGRPTDQTGDLRVAVVGMGQRGALAAHAHRPGA